MGTSIFLSSFGSAHHPTALGVLEHGEVTPALATPMLTVSFSSISRFAYAWHHVAFASVSCLALNKKPTLRKCIDDISYFTIEHTLGY